MIIVLSHSISQRRFLLFYHFFAVAFYAIWVMFTHPRPVAARKGGIEKQVMRRPGIEQYPFLLAKSVQVVSHRNFSASSLLILSKNANMFQWYAD